MIFAYWDALRGERAAPDRGDIEPGRMRHVLADTFILASEDGLPATFRLAGTRTCALFGGEMKGRRFDSLWPGERRSEANRLADTVMAETAGLVIGVLGTNESGSQIALELVLLPLRHRGRTDARILGTISPASLPSWLGLVPLRSLETLSLRVVQPMPPQGRASVQEARMAGGDRGRRFVVLEGGKS